MRTTLNKIRAHSPCAYGWKKLLAHLGKTGPDDEPLTILTILESNGVEDAIWCLRAVDGQDGPIRLFAVWCARQMQHLLKDKRSLDALDVAEKYAKGLATAEDLKAAYIAAGKAVKLVGYHVAYAAVCAATRPANHYAASCSAYSAAYAAREVAMYARDSLAERSAACNTARQAQEQELRRVCNTLGDPQDENHTNHPQQEKL